MHDYIDNQITDNRLLSPISKIWLSLYKHVQNKTSTDSNGMSMNMLKKTTNYLK